jgi:formylglycine-generating enzyme required for sulfatase activity
VIIDGVSHDMDLVSGDYRDGALFRYQTALSMGSHSYLFSFSDLGHAPVSTAVVSGPWVGEVCFLMGSPPGEPGRDADETQHLVVLGGDIWFSDHEVSQAEYQAVMHANPSRFAGADLPVERVSWFDAVTYCYQRSLDEGLTPAYDISGLTVTWNPLADGYRLPTEAEWEAACRAGTGGAFPGGTLIEEGCGLDPVLDGLGWYCGNAAATTHAVVSKSGNSRGLLNMNGNVWEWCWDWYVAELGADVAADPEGPASGSQRVIRGGSWYHFARECRSASRAPYWPNSADDVVGFRVVRSIPRSTR